MDSDPLNVRCDACGAEPAEPCRPDCVGLAKYNEEQEAANGASTAETGTVVPDSDDVASDTVHG